MTAKNPLVVYNGVISELQSGDTINGASGGSGTTILKGTSIIDFGSAPGTNFITSTISGISNISSSSVVMLQISYIDNTSSHNYYEHLIASKYIQLGSNNIVTNTSFDISAFTELRLTGTFTIRYTIFN